LIFCAAVLTAKMHHGLGVERQNGIRDSQHQEDKQHKATVNSTVPCPFAFSRFRDRWAAAGSVFISTRELNLRLRTGSSAAISRAENAFATIGEMRFGGRLRTTGGYAMIPIQKVNVDGVFHADGVNTAAVGQPIGLVLF